MKFFSGLLRFRRFLDLSAEGFLFRLLAFYLGLELYIWVRFIGLCAFIGISQNERH